MCVYCAALVVWCGVRPGSDLYGRILTVHCVVVVWCVVWCAVWGGRSGSDLYGRILIVHCVVVGVVCDER